MSLLRNSAGAFVVLCLAVTVTEGGPGFVETKITPSDGILGDIFGVNVEAGDNTFVVGASLHDESCPSTTPNCNTGSAYVFEKRGESWVQTAKLTASDAAASDFFGAQVILSGNIAVISATGVDFSCPPADLNCRPGAVYVFERLGGAWLEVAKLTASDAAARDVFGIEAAVAGNTIVVGANRNDDVCTHDSPLFSKT